MENIRFKNMTFNNVNFKFAKRSKKSLYADMNITLELNIKNSVEDDIYKSEITSYILKIDNQYIYGNSMDELDDLLQSLSYTFCGDDDNCYLPIYVADLNYYHYFFLKNFGNIKDIKSVNGSVCYLHYFNIEFRCLGVFADLNTEHLYNYIDISDESTVQKRVDILSNFLSESLNLYLTKDKEPKYTYANLPLTQIKYVKDELNKYKSLSFSEYNLLGIRELREYSILRMLPSGGVCSYNSKYVNKTIDNVYCFDFVSAYIAVMGMYNLYPVSYYKYEPKLVNKKYLEYIKNYSVISRVVLKNLKKKKYYPGFKEKHIVEGFSSNVVLNDDDEILYADSVQLYLTDIDFMILKKSYDFELIGSVDNYIYNRGRLPKSLVKCVLNFYKKKNDKTVSDLVHTLYKKAVNSTYGLNDIDPLKSYPNYGDFFIKPKTDLEAQVALNDYNKMQSDGKNYSSFHWGIYIAAIQRLLLNDFIDKAIKLDCWLYSDTDSLYVKKNENFFKYVKEFNNKIIKHNEKYLHIDFSNLGLLELDGVYDKFKVFGKKQYIVFKNDEIIATFSGVDKKKLSDYFTVLYKFMGDEFFNMVKRGYKIERIHKYYIETYTGVYTDYSDFIIGGKYV